MIKSKWMFVPFLVMIWVSCRKNPTHSNRIIHIDHMVDLTHTLTADFPFIPVKQLTYPFELIPMATLEANGVEANSWKIHEHLGTHIDAPNHFIKNQLSVDQIELRNLIVPLVVINIAAKAALNPDAELTVEDIKKFEKRFGKIPKNACVMMYSGWENRLRDHSFVGLDSSQTKHYPGFSTEAIDFLLTNRIIAGLGVDVLSFDPGIDENYTGHKMLFAAGKWGVECVANLHQVPQSGATIIIGAPKVGKATGGFSRIIAVW
jgi:kynurenine formamidase